MPADRLFTTPFPKLWTSQILSQIAQNLLNFALIIQVFELASHSRFANVAVGMLILSFGVPSIIFAALAGVYVDYWDRKKVLVVTNLLRALLVLGYMVVGANLWLILALSFVVSAVTQFFTPAEAAAIPSLVSKQQLVSANSLFVFTMYGSFIVGYSLAGPVISLMGDRAPFYLTSAMFAIAGLLCLFLPPLRVAQIQTRRFGAILRTAKAEILTSWRTILENHNLYYPIFQLTMTQTLVGIILTLAPALSLALLKLALPDASHVLIIPAGLGMVVGVLLVGQLIKRWDKINLIALGTTLAALALMSLGLSGQLYRNLGDSQIASIRTVTIIVAILVFVLGLMNAWISVTSQTLLQEHSSEELRGRVFGALNMLINVAATVPIFLAGILADLFSVTKVIFTLGAAVLLYGLWQAARLRQIHASVESE